jgi:RNA polymerase sigma-70 factor (ECF subfamily)
MEDHSDIQLIEAFLDLEEDSYFEELYNRYKQKTYWRCYSLLQHRNEAEDLHQEVWSKIYFKLDTFRGDSEFSTWLFRITTNHCLNHLRSRKSIVSLRAELTIEPVQLDTKVENEINVTNILSVLSKSERTLLFLKYVEEYSYEEISELTGVSISALKMRILRIKSKLQNQNEPNNRRPNKTIT